MKYVLTVIYCTSRRRPTAYESARFGARESSVGGVINQQQNIRNGFCKHPFSPSYSFFSVNRRTDNLDHKPPPHTHTHTHLFVQSNRWSSPKFNPLAQPMFLSGRLWGLNKMRNVLIALQSHNVYTFQGNDPTNVFILTLKK